jgi:hypothetical protein
MKIAICIQGLIGKSWSPSVYEEYFYKTLIKPNLDHEIDIFLQTWTTVDSFNRHSRNTIEKYNTELINKNQIINLYGPKDYIIEEFSYKDFVVNNFTDKKVISDKNNNQEGEIFFDPELGYNKNINVHAGFIQVYTWHKTTLMCEKYDNYDVGIRTRFDIMMNRPLDLNKYDFDVDFMYGDISCSGNNEYGFCPDLFFGPYKIFKQINYFKNISSFLKERNSMCNIESFNEYYLLKSGIKFKQSELFYPPDFARLLR